jgi:HSP20 family protein
MSAASYRSDTLGFLDHGRWIDEFFNSSIFGFSTLPEVEVRESDDEYIMEVDLPGMSEDDFEVEQDGDLFTVLGHKDSGEFRRSFLLPGDVDRQGISHEYRCGMLLIRFPRTVEK